MQESIAIKVQEAAKGDVLTVGRLGRIETFEVLSDPTPNGTDVSLYVVSFSLDAGARLSGTERTLQLPAKQVVLNTVGGELKKAAKKKAAKKTATKKKAAKKKAKKKTSRR